MKYKVNSLMLRKNLIESLEGCPEEVGNDFDCSKTDIRNLIGGPKIVKGVYNCGPNAYLISLEGAPKEVYEFYTNDCPNLKSLVGGPKIVKDTYYCSRTGLESFEGAPEEVEVDFWCTDLIHLKSLKGLPKHIGRNFCCKINPSKHPGKIFPFTEEEVRAVCQIDGKFDMTFA
jgi:hypothetical protein